MEFKVNSRNSITQSKLQKIADGSQPLTDVSCGFFDPESKRISVQGCSVLAVTPTSVKCGCNHMTDFMSFLKTGLTVLEGSNYDVFLAVTQLTPSNLMRNVGFYFSIGYWGSFLIFLLVVLKCDKRRLRDSYFEKYFLVNKGEKVETP